MQIDIKQLKSGDEAILDRVAAEVFDEPIDAARLAAYLADLRHHLFVAVTNGEVVGQVAAVMVRHPDKPAELFIDEVGVAPAWRRKGIARKLLDEMLALGKALGCEEAWVGTEMDNLPARALYESYGVPGGRFVMYTFDL
jgi:aminoglycoside 6'-N-acetyltransferase I